MERAYGELLDSNLDLRIKLVKEETLGITKDSQICRHKIKIYDLECDIRQYERHIDYLEKEVVVRDDEIERLKSDCQAVLQKLKDCNNLLELKEEASAAQDEHIIQLEGVVEDLKKRLHELSPTTSP